MHKRFELSVLHKLIPMYRLWLHSLYVLHGPRCPLSQKRLLNLITPSLTGLTLNGACTSATYNGRERGRRRSLTKCSISLFGRLPGSWPWRFRRHSSRGIGDGRFWKSAQVCWLESHPKGLLFCGYRLWGVSGKLPRSWREMMKGREMMIGVTRTRIAVVIWVRTIPTCKHILSNSHHVLVAAREVGLVQATHRAVVPPNPELTVLLELIPSGTGLPRMKVQLELAHHGAGQKPS